MKTLLALLLTTSLASAQVPDGNAAAVEATAQIATLARLVAYWKAQAEQAQAQIAKLKKELPDAQPKPEPSPSDGDGRTQP